MSAHPLLEIEGLSVRYGPTTAVADLSLSVAEGEVVALVGESGSGKSTTALAALGLLPPAARVDAGTILWDGRVDLVGADERTLRALRGRDIALVPQDPTVSLDPTQRVGRQVAEALRVHGLVSRGDAGRRTAELLAEAGIDEPERRALQFPHQLSGGLRQRVLIAIAWACKPRLIVADEPTSALDVTVQRQVLDRLDALRAENGTSILLVTHDLGVAADRADRVVVMTEGRIVEEGPTARVLGRPEGAYTRRLLAALPGRGPDRGAARPAPDVDEPPLVEADHLVKEFAVTDAGGARTRLRAVDDVSFTIARGRTLAVVGESGSGKSTSARLVMRLEQPTSGRIVFDGEDVSAQSGAALRASRRRFQLIQQNPYSSLSPQWEIGRIVSEPLRSFRVGARREREARALELLDRVGLPASYLRRRPHQLSGGQRQRVAIARALALRPELVVCDEPVSALDVSVQAQILELLAELQRDLGLAYLFISHDLAVVRDIADEVMVMKRGRVVESGAVDEVFHHPTQDYTRQLIDAIPGRDGVRR